MPDPIRVSAICVFSIVLAVTSIASAELKQNRPVFRAGAAAVDITPKKFPVSMTGSFSDRQATFAHDRLHARCIVLDDGQMRVAIVVCDICLISREIFDKAKTLASKATGIPTNRILSSATHTHTAPTAVALAQCHPNPDYVKHLTLQIAKSIELAASRLVPAKVGWGVTTEPDEVFNRRWKMKAGAIRANPFGETTDRVRMNPPRGSSDLIEPAGPTDPEISFLSVQSQDGKPIALLASYSLHYVGGIPAGGVSADYFGEFARQIQERLGAENPESSFVGILANGTSGDINNYNFRHPRPAAKPFQRMRAVAGRVADKVFAVYQALDHHDWVPLKMAQRELEFKIRRPDSAGLARAQKLLAEAKGPTLRGLPQVYAQETVRIANGPKTVKLLVQALRIGELGIAANPCESFAEIGLEIKKRSPLKPTFNIGLANGYNGYLPTPRQHAVSGYETWRSGWSYLEVNASQAITNTIVQLLEEVSK